MTMELRKIHMPRRGRGPKGRTVVVQVLGDVTVRQMKRGGVRVRIDTSGLANANLSRIMALAKRQGFAAGQVAAEGFNALVQKRAQKGHAHAEVAPARVHVTRTSRKFGWALKMTPDEIQSALAKAS